MLLDSKMQDLGCRYLQMDEVWGFIGKKERHLCVSGDDPEMGDVWTYCAIDSETKLVPTFKVGKRKPYYHHGVRAGRCQSDAESGADFDRLPCTAIF